MEVPEKFVNVDAEAGRIPDFVEPFDSTMRLLQIVSFAALMSGLFSPSSLHAQDYGIEVEVVSEDIGMLVGALGITDLSGYSCSRVYITMENENDFLSSISGDANNPSYVNTTTNFYHAILGGTTPNGINSLLFPVYPDLAYDSWVTIGLEGTPNAVAGEAAVSTVASSLNPWSTNFDPGAGLPGGNIAIDDAVGGAWYALNGDANGVAGADLKVLAGQFTTTGDLSVQMYTQIFINGDGFNEYLPDGVNRPSFIWPVTAVEGCTDDTACNYNADATNDDGSCTYADAGLDCDGNCLADADGDGICDGDEIAGCQDNTACNYDATATDDDGSCTYADAGLDCDGNCLADADGDGICDGDEIAGCQDNTACNYNATATDDDGSCSYADAGLDCDGNCLADADGDGICDGDEIAGCQDDTACNYDTDATDDDGSCTYAEAGLDCDGNCLADADGDGICDGDEIAGCQDDTACNYTATATDDDGSCTYADTGLDCDGNCLADADGDGICDGDEIAGCQDDTACNYDANATDDDGSCTYAEAGLNCDGNCLADADGDGICDGDEIAGCQDDTACNYNADATDDDGSCTYADAGLDCDGNCLADADGDGICDGDEIAGCTDEAANNFDPAATDDDGSCDYTCGPDWGEPNTYPSVATVLALITVDGENAAMMDAVGAFVGDELRGEGDIIEFEGATYINMTVYLAGAEEMVDFIFFNQDECSTCTIDADLTAMSFGEYGSFADPLMFDANCTATTLDVELAEGWNYVSTNVMPESYAMESLFDEALGGSLLKVLGDDAFALGGSYTPGIPSVFNSLQMHSDAAGYVIKVDADGLWSSSGEPLDAASTPLDLNEGWNIIGYVPQAAMSVEDALASIDGAVGTVIDGQNGTVWNPANPNEFNSLLDMEPGRSYWVRMLAAATLTYPEMDMDGSGMVLAPLRTEDAAQSMTGWNVTVSPFAAALAAEIRLDEAPVEGEAYIGAFDGETCVAARPVVSVDGWTGAQMAVMLEQSADIQFRLWVDGVEFTSTDMLSLSAGDELGQGGDVLPVLRFASAANAVVDAGWVDGFALAPMPAHSTTWLDLDLQSAGQARITVLDARGAEMAVLHDGQLAGGQHRIALNVTNWAAGTYFIQGTSARGFFRTPLIVQ